MPKPKANEKESKDLKSLSDVVELKFEGWEEVVFKLEKLNDLQALVGKKPDDKKGKEGAGLLAEIHNLKSELSAIMAVAGVEGLRHNNLAFSDCYIEGRETLDLKTMMVELAQEGVELEVIKKCVKAATKKGDGYFRRMLVDLNKPRGDWED